MEEAELSYTAELSVSKQTFLDCYEVALFLHKQGIVSNVTTNITTQPNIEYGCKITQPVVKNKEIKNNMAFVKKSFWI